MCGICGIVGVESRERGEALVRRMMAAIVHRGPDEEGILIAPPVVAGGRRLSIIDLPGGSQPVWNETETLAIVYNGEIYNFRELRKELESAGHTFRTHSDTEVIVHAYEAWGEKCVERLQRNVCVCDCRDAARAQRTGGARFSRARPDGNQAALLRDCRWGFVFCVGGARALSQRRGGGAAFGGCDCFLPLVWIGERAADVGRGRFFASAGPLLDVQTGDEADSSSCSEALLEWVERARARNSRLGTAAGAVATPAMRVRSLLEKAVASHLIADVPVGVFLSSGLDSTAIAALASRAQRGIHTFTVAFPDVEFSEAEIARRTAERLGTDHSELTLSGEEMLARLDEAVAAFDQPSMDGINTYFVSWAARQAGLKVALSGLGQRRAFRRLHIVSSDVENAGAWRRRLRWMPKPLRQLVAPRAALPSFPGRRPTHLEKRLLHGSIPLRCRILISSRARSLPRRRVARWLREDASSWRATAWGQWLAERGAKRGSMDDFTGVSWLELRSYMVNTLLRDTDAMSMRHSLEVRVPFLDSPLVEYVLVAARIAEAQRRAPKALLIAALGDLLPEEICCAAEAHFYISVGELDARRAAASASRRDLRDWSPALEPLFSGENRAAGLGRFSRRPHDLVAPLEPLRAERMGEAAISAEVRRRAPTRSERCRCFRRLIAQSQLRETTRHLEMIILGINAYHANASAAIVVDGRLLAAVEEERLNRVKYAAGLPARAIQYCLDQAGVKLTEVDHIAIPRDPLGAPRHQTALRDAHAALRARSRARDGALRRHSRGTGGGVRNCARKQFALNFIASSITPRIWPALFSFRHLNVPRCFPPTASAISPAPCGPSAKARDMRILGEITFPHSLGMYYTALTQYLGFWKFGDEYKVMGLAAYGQPEFLEEFRHIVRADGPLSFRLGLEYFTHQPQGAEMTWRDASAHAGARPAFLAISRKTARPGAPGGRAARAASSQSCRQHASCARRSAGSRTGTRSRRKPAQKSLCLAGGVAFNCVANGKIFDQHAVRACLRATGGGRCRAFRRCCVRRESSRSSGGRANS